MKKKILFIAPILGLLASCGTSKIDFGNLYKSFGDSLFNFKINGTSDSSNAYHPSPSPQNDLKSVSTHSYFIGLCYEKMPDYDSNRMVAYNDTLYKKTGIYAISDVKNQILTVGLLCPNLSDPSKLYGCLFIKSHFNFDTKVIGDYDVFHGSTSPQTGQMVAGHSKRRGNEFTNLDLNTKDADYEAAQAEFLPLFNDAKTRWATWDETHIDAYTNLFKEAENHFKS